MNMSFIKSKSENNINPNLLTIKETEEILDMMKNNVFEVTVNNKKKMKALLLKTPLEKKNFKKILIVFYEGDKEEINYIKIENKSSNINVKLNIDNSRKTYYDKYFVFIEIKSDDKIKENAFFSVNEKIKKKVDRLANRKYVYKMFYTDKIYFYLGNQEDESIWYFPNFITIKDSLLVIILNPENKKVISINYYNSFNRIGFINNEFIIDAIERLTFQERKNTTNFFQKIFNNIFKPKNDLIEEMSNINVETEDSETQLDKPKISIEKDNTELNSFFENGRNTNKIDFILENDYIIKSLCNIVIIKYDICKYSSGFFIKLKFNDKQKYFIMTCEHMIDSKMINKNETIKIIYDQKTKSNKIKLDRKERIIQDFKFLNIDATLIEIIEKDIIKGEYFFSPYMDDVNECKDKKISIASYTSENLYKEDGSFISINPISYKFNHSLNTNNGLSGAPIFLKDNSNYMIIGLHIGKSKLKNYNIGNFIYPIVSIISNGYHIYKIIKYGEYVYEGEIKDNKRDGYGKLILENGIYYIGQWKNDMKHGKGTLYKKDNSLIYEGDFENDKYNGFGKSNEENGHSYIGQWKDGFKHGLGKLYNQKNNIIYEGNFENGMRNGIGKYFENKGKYYIGQWLDNKKDEIEIEINEKDDKQIYINPNNNSQKYFYSDDNYYID